MSFLQFECVSILGNASCGVRILGRPSGPLIVRLSYRDSSSTRSIKRVVMASTDQSSTVIRVVHLSILSHHSIIKAIFLFLVFRVEFGLMGRGRSEEPEATTFVPLEFLRLTETPASEIFGFPSSRALIYF